MKTTLIGPIYPYRGGIAHYNAYLARALSNHGHTVRMISFHRQYPASLYPGKSDRDPSVEPLSFPAEYLLDPLYPWTWLYTAQAIQKNPPDVLLLHWWTTFWAPAYTCLTWIVRKKVKTIFLIHNVLPHEAKPWDRLLARAALRQGHFYIVQAPHEHERLVTLLHNPQGVIDAPLPAYQPFSNLALSQEDSRQQLQLPAKGALLLFFGIVRPYKGLSYLLEALARTQRPMHLVVAGEFWDDIRQYKKQIETLGIQNKVTIYNRYIPNEEAHKLFIAADGLVAPYIGGTQSAAAGVAIGYGLPMIVTERIAAGLPAGYPASRSAPIGTQDSGYAQIVPAADSDALAQAMDTLTLQLPSLKKHTAIISNDWTRLVRVIEEIGARTP